MIINKLYTYTFDLEYLLTNKCVGELNIHGISNITHQNRNIHLHNCLHSNEYQKVEFNLSELKLRRV